MPKRDYYAPIVRNWIYPLAQRLQGRDFPAAMRQGLKNQHLSQDQLRELQMRKASALVRHAFETVPYYRKSFARTGLSPEDILTREDFENLPLLTKDLLRENFHDLFSAQPVSGLLNVRTSGSTGAPLQSRISQRSSLSSNVCRIRALQWWGIELGDRMVYLSNAGYSFKPGLGKYLYESLYTPLRAALMNRRFFTAYTMTPENMRVHWETILRFKPTYIFGFPSGYAVFADYLREKGYDGAEASLKLVVTLGEVLHGWQAELISETFGCPVGDEYGGVEVGLVAHSHPCGVMHTMDDRLIVEVIRERPEDKYGQVVVTDLDNWSFPIIRYNMNDLAKLVRWGHGCSLGLGLGVLEGLLGRDQDVIRLKSGRIIYCHYFHNLLKHVDGVRQYQVIQKKPGLFEFKIVAQGDSFGPEGERYLRETVWEHLEGSRVEINLVDQIPRDPSGKLRFVLSELHPKPERRSDSP
jgi:phenylacetate-CoA ligase